MADLNVIYRIAADITGLQDGVNRAATAAEGLGTTAKRVGTVLSAAFTGLQIKQVASEVTAFASNISDLAAKSGISAEAVQELDFVAKQSGSTFETVSQAIALMGDRLVNGDKGTVNALNTLGLSLDDLRKMAPDEAFEAIATAITKIEDPMVRSNVALDLFGKSGANLLPTLTSDIVGLRDKARELGLVMSNETVKGGDDLDDKFAELEARVNAVKGNALTPLMQYFLDMPGWMQVGVAGISEFSGALTGIGTTIMLAGGPVAILGTLKTALMGLAGLLTLPAGLVVAAVVGLVAIWYKWDEIKVIAENVYNAVKMWLVDKFTAVVDSIKGKIDAVTGFFSNMYDKVVGKSYVPDMITQIGEWFSKLPQVMTVPAELATGSTSKAFANMQSSTLSSLSSLGSQIDGIFGSDIAGMFQRFDQGPLGGLVKAFETSFGPKMSRIMDGLKSAISNGLTVARGIAGAFAGDFSGVVDGIMAGIDLVKQAWGALKGLFGGGEEGTIVNPARDSWFGKYGGSVQDVGNKLAEFGVDGETARQMIERVFKAKKKSEFDAASRAIDDITGLALGGLVMQPTLAMVGEAGPELVTPLRDVERMGLGGNFEEVTNELRSLRREAARDRRLAPHQMITAWLDALALSSR